MPWARGWTLSRPGTGWWHLPVDGTGLADVAVARADLTVPVPSGLDLATATTIPLTWATAFGLVRVSHAGASDTVLVTAASGGVGSAIGQLLARQGAACVIGGVRSPAQAGTLAAAYTPVTQGEGFVARALQTAGVPGFDVVLESVGGSVLASVLGGLAVGGRVVSYGAAAGEPDPAPPPVPDLRTQNLTITGFSILNRARKAPPTALSLIQGRSRAHPRRPAHPRTGRRGLGRGDRCAHRTKRRTQPRKNSRTSVTRSPATVRHTSRLCRVYRSVFPGDAARQVVRQPRPGPGRSPVAPVPGQGCHAYLSRAGYLARRHPRHHPHAYCPAGVYLVGDGPD